MPSAFFCLPEPADCCIMFLFQLLNDSGISFEEAFVLYALMCELGLKQCLFLDPLTLHTTCSQVLFLITYSFFKMTKDC